MRVCVFCVSCFYMFFSLYRKEKNQHLSPNMYSRFI
nr:MAG TPA: hypothetical protein [Caudoviricetes sp.]